MHFYIARTKDNKVPISQPISTCSLSEKSLKKHSQTLLAKE